MDRNQIRNTILANLRPGGRPAQATPRTADKRPRTVTLYA